ASFRGRTGWGRRGEGLIVCQNAFDQDAGRRDGSADARGLEANDAVGQGEPERTITRTNRERGVFGAELWRGQTVAFAEEHRGQRGRLVRGKIGDGFFVEPDEAVVRAQPERVLAIVKNLEDEIVREAFTGREGLETMVAPAAE